MTIFVTFENSQIDTRKKNMNKEKQKGFSLVELLIVVVIVGLIASIAIPYLTKALHASQNNNIYASLKSAAATQVNFFTHNNRFARLDELNNEMGGVLGTQDNDDLVRGQFTISMSPNSNPTDAELREGYTIIATRQISGSDLPYLATIDQSGTVTDNLFSQY